MKSTNNIVQNALNSVAANAGKSDKLVSIYKRVLNKPGDKVEMKQVEKLPGGFERWHLALFAQYHDEDREMPDFRIQQALKAGQSALYTVVGSGQKIANDGSVTANVTVMVRGVGNSVAANEKPYGPFDVKRLVRDAYKMTIDTPPDELKKKFPNILRSMGGKARADYVKKWGEAAVKKAEEELRAGNSVAKNEMSSRDFQTIGDAIDEARRNLQLAIRFCKANAGEDNIYVKNLPALEKALKELWKF